MTERTSPPVSLKSWLEQVDHDPNIPLEFKNGAQDQLKLTGTSFSSGSELKPEESLHLRVIWSKYLWIKDIKNLMVDDPKTGYTGYVSPENMATASLIFDNKRRLWQSYFKELGLRENETKMPAGIQIFGVLHGMGVPSYPLGPPRECGTLQLVLYWQLLSTTTDIDEIPTADDIRRTSSISKFGPEFDPALTAKLTPAAFNQPMTPYKSILDGQMEQDTPTPAFDEFIVNMALLDFLHAIKLDVGMEFCSLDWLARRLPLKLMEKIRTSNSETAEVKMQMRKIMEAQLDGYLSRKTSPFLKELSMEPLAILEAKPYTRSSALASIRRQEGAEMACWISQAGDSKTGLLRASTSGRKRRLMISQDRHQIYIIVGEYGAGFEDHIRTSRSMVGGSAKSQQKTGKAGSSIAETSTELHGLHATSDSTEERRDPRLLAGSPSYIIRVERKSIDVAAEPRGRRAQPTRAASAARKSSRTNKKWVPDAGDFLIMHEFGPFITTDPIHMEVFIKRLIAFMLELRGPQDRFMPERPGPEFLAQSGQVGPSTPNESSSNPKPALPKSYSWPGEMEKSAREGVVIHRKTEWHG